MTVAAERIEGLEREVRQKKGEVGMDWQLIETALRDGTIVLLWAREFGSPADPYSITMGSCEGYLGRMTCNGDEFTGWTSIESELDGHPDEGDFMVPKKIVPTRWMPLPSEP
jgi:hypothetical protein